MMSAFIYFTCRELMELFQDTFTSPHDFGSSFLHLDFLNLYTLYCTSYAQGNECLERSLNENQNLRDFIEVRGTLSKGNIFKNLSDISGFTGSLLLTSH